MVTLGNILGESADVAYDVYVSEGSVYVVGYSDYNDGTSGGIVIKMNENGVLDNNFGTNGVKVINDVDKQDVVDGCTAVYVEGSNVYALLGSGPYYYVKKLDAGNGNEIVSSQRLERTISLPDEIESSGDGNIILGTTGYNSNTAYIYITKLNKNSLGVLNEKRIMPSDFGNFGSYERLNYSDHYVSGGNVYVVGTLDNVNNLNGTDVAVIKLNSTDLSYDNNFGFGGKLLLDTMTSDTFEDNVIYSIFMYGASLYMTGYYLRSSGVSGLALRMDNLQ